MMMIVMMMMIMMLIINTHVLVYIHVYNIISLDGTHLSGSIGVSFIKSIKNTLK
jgi:hypothetical protein